MMNQYASGFCAIDSKSDMGRYVTVNEDTLKAVGGLSAKTVDHYLDADKLKLNCEPRSDLIMQVIERGLVGVF